MYDKYNNITAVTPGSTRLGKHKALLIVNNTTGTFTIKGYDVNGVPTGNIVIPAVAATVEGFTIFPMYVYSVEAASGCTVYTIS